MFVSPSSETTTAGVTRDKQVSRLPRFYDITYYRHKRTREIDLGSGPNLRLCPFYGYLYERLYLTHLDNKHVWIGVNHSTCLQHLAKSLCSSHETRPLSCSVHPLHIYTRPICLHIYQNTFIYAQGISTSTVLHHPPAYRSCNHPSTNRTVHRPRTRIGPHLCKT